MAPKDANYKRDLFDEFGMTDDSDVDDRIRLGMKIEAKNRRAEHMLGMPRDDADNTLRDALQADYPLVKEGIRD